MKELTYKYSVIFNGVTFKYNTAKELAELMCSGFDCFYNPYEPQTIEYDEFNEACYSIPNRSSP